MSLFKPILSWTTKSLLLLVTSSVLTVKDNFVSYMQLVQGEEIFQPIPERAQFKQVGVRVGVGEKGKNPFNIDLKIPIKIPRPTYLFLHLILRS